MTYRCHGLKREILLSISVLNRLQGYLELNVYSFYPRDAMLARVIVIATCLSVRPSICHAPVLCQSEES